MHRIHSATEIEEFRKLADGDGEATISAWRKRFQSSEVQDSREISRRNLPVQNDLTPIIDKRIEAMPSTFEFVADSSRDGSEELASGINEWAAGPAMQDGRSLFVAYEEITRDQEVDGASPIVMIQDEVDNPRLVVRDLAQMEVETKDLQPRLVESAKFTWHDEDGHVFEQTITPTSQILTKDGNSLDVSEWVGWLPLVIIPRNFQKHSPLGSSSIPPLKEAYLSVLNALAWLNLSNKYSGKVWCPHPSADDGWALGDADNGPNTSFRIMPGAFHPVPLAQVGSDSQPTGLLEQYREALQTFYRLGKVRMPGQESADMRSGKAMIVDTLELRNYIRSKLAYMKQGLEQIADMYAWITGAVEHPNSAGIYVQFPDLNSADPQEQRERSKLFLEARKTKDVTRRQMFAAWQANGMFDDDANPDDLAAEVEEEEEESQAGSMAAAVRMLNQQPPQEQPQGPGQDMPEDVSEDG